MSRRPVLFLFGPTAVGKTGLLESLAGTPIEVVSADSMQVYRGMDIGTAKPDAALRSRIPHHLIDIRDPDEQYDVGAFVDDANAAIDEILARSRLPVVSGGTGYYFKHLLFGLPESPPSDPEIRERIRLRADTDGLPALYDELSRVDPASAERIGPNDRYRVTRALEVYEQTGRPLSSFAMTGESRDDVAVTSVRLARERRELLGRIRERVRTMFEDGLREEVERLLAGGYGPGDPGLRAIGYREFFTSTGELRPAGEDETIAGEIAANTRRYAKRQETFFRQLPDVVDVRTGGTGADGGQALNVASVGGECGPEWVVGLVERLCGELDSA